MEPEGIIVRALDHYLLYIQMGEHYDGERRKSTAIECVSYIKDGGVVDKDWLISKNLFFIDVFSEYSAFLEREILNAIPNDEEIRRLKKEQTAIDTLLKALRQVFWGT